MADFTDEEADHLVKVFKDLGVKPKGDTPSEIHDWMFQYLQLQGKLPKEKSPSTNNDTSVTHNVSVNARIPNICSFSGNRSAKNENFDLWRYEVQCLMVDKQYCHEAIAEAARRSLKGEAARVVKRLGVGASVNAMLNKLDGLFGNVHLAEDILAKFYNAQQRPDEDVAIWSCRIEDLLEQASMQKAISQADKEERLRNKLYSGLKDSLKSRTHHLFLSISDYDEFRVQLRRMEYDMNKEVEAEPQSTSAQSEKTVIQSHVNANVSSVSEQPNDEFKRIISQLTQENQNLKQQLETRNTEQTLLQQTSFAHVDQNHVKDNRCHRNGSHNPFFPVNAASISDSRLAIQTSSDRYSNNTNTFNAQAPPWYPAAKSIARYPPPPTYQHNSHYQAKYLQPQQSYQSQGFQPRRITPRAHQQCWRCAQYGHLQYECNVLLNNPLN
jgi:hypothetical protein